MNPPWTPQEGARSEAILELRPSGSPPGSRPVEGMLRASGCSVVPGAGLLPLSPNGTERQLGRKKKLEGLMSQVVFRFKKIKTITGVVGSVAHNERTAHPENADPSRGIDVLISAGPDPAIAFAKKLEGIWRRKDAVLAVEAVLSASPEYFASDQGKIEYGKWNMEKVESFRSAGVDFFKKEFGDKIISLSFHLDEATPHFQCVFVPIVDGKLNAKSVMGDRIKMREWQDKAAAAVQHLGIERGIPGSKAKHESVKRYYGNVNNEFPKIPSVKTKIPVLKERTIAEKIPFSDAKRERDLLELEAEQKRREREVEIKKRTKALADVAEQAFDKASNHDLLQKMNKELRVTLLHKDKEMETMKMENLKLKEQANRLRSLPLHDVLTSVYGAELCDGSKESHASRKYKVGDSKIGVSPSGLDRSTEVWIDNTTSKGRKGAIDLVMYLSDCDYKGAVRILADHFDRNDITSEMVHRVAISADSSLSQIIKEPVQLPVADASKWEKVRQYLTEARKLSAKLVDDLHSKGKIFADKFGNAVFPRENEGAFLRSTVTAWKQTLGGKEKGPYLIDGTGGTVFVESPIDAMSLKMQHREDRILAIGGNLLVPEDLTGYVLPGKDVFLAFDSDKAGEMMALKFWQKWPEAIRLMPICKDFNADLVAGKMLLPGDESDVPLDKLFKAKQAEDPGAFPGDAKSPAGNDELDHDDDGFKGPGW